MVGVVRYFRCLRHARSRPRSRARVGRRRGGSRTGLRAGRAEPAAAAGVHLRAAGGGHGDGRQSGARALSWPQARRDRDRDGGDDRSAGEQGQVDRVRARLRDAAAASTPRARQAHGDDLRLLARRSARCDAAGGGEAAWRPAHPARRARGPARPRAARRSRARGEVPGAVARVAHGARVRRADGGPRRQAPDQDERQPVEDPGSERDPAEGHAAGRARGTGAGGRRTRRTSRAQRAPDRRRGACSHQGARRRTRDVPAARRHGQRQDRGLPARARGGPQAREERDRPRARDLAHAADRRPLRVALLRRRRPALGLDRRRTRPAVATPAARRGTDRDRRAFGAVRARARPRPSS